MPEETGSTAEQVKEQAQEAKQQARRTLRDQVDSRSSQAGEQVSQQAGDIRSLSQELRKQGKDGPARIAGQAADRADKLGAYLTQSDADRILHDVEDFARSNPWAVMAAGLAAGFVASRFLKASSSDRYHDRTPGRPPQLTQPGSDIGTGSERFERPTPAVPPAPAPATGPATTGQI